jgi:bifunctional non-homologous end joining protein LigD
VDYNQNAWGRTLASVYSVRPQPNATVSAPITWKELDQGVRIEDFRMDNMGQRIKRVGDLWSPLLAEKGRAHLDSFYRARGMPVHIANSGTRARAKQARSSRSQTSGG